MGDHTDYSDGLALPMAIDRQCTIELRRRHDLVSIRSLDMPSGSEWVACSPDGSTDPRAVEPAWGGLAAGVVRTLSLLGRPAIGMDAVVSSTIPLGAGLASSAAFEVAVALGLCDIAGFRPSKRELARACRDAEHVASGVECGIMDQLTALEGVHGHALLIDCRSLDVQPVAIPEDLVVLAIHSGVVRGLSETGYTELRRSAAAAAGRLAVPALRDADSQLAEREPLARHVLSESSRVVAAAEALASGDRATLRELFSTSHDSLRDDVGVSTVELDTLVESLLEAGAIGARLTGAGFGGCVVALAERSTAIGVAERATTRYARKSGRRAEVFVCRPSAGAGLAD
jgi:galactokinase